MNRCLWVSPLFALVSSVNRLYISSEEMFSISSVEMGPGVAQWLRHCATSRAVPGSNPGGLGHRDFSRGYRQNHVPWGQLRL